MSRITPFQIAMGTGTAGALEDVSTYADLAAGVQRSWGRRTDFEDVTPGTFSFVLDNSDGRFTPGNTSSPLTTTVTEGMAVCWNTGGRLVTGTILGIEPTFPSGESAWAQIRITCDDMLGNAGRRTIKDPFVDALNEGATQFILWPLDDAAGTIVPAESTGNAANLLVLSGSNGSVFGSPAVDGLGAGTQLLLKDYLQPVSAWPTFTFSYPATSLGFYSCWITPTTSTSKVTVSVSLSGLARSLQFGYSSGTYFVRDGDAGTTATYSLLDNSAHFVSMGLTYAGTTLTLTLYVDGTSRGSTTYATALASIPYKAPIGVTFAAGV